MNYYFRLENKASKKVTFIKQWSSKNGASAGAEVKRNYSENYIVIVSTEEAYNKGNKKF